MTESNLFAELKKTVQRKSIISMERVETGGMPKGFPDMIYYTMSPKKYFGFAELKIVQNVSAPRIKIPWRPRQRYLCNRFYEAGENVKLIVADRNKLVAILSPPFYETYENVTYYSLEKLTSTELYTLLTS